MLQQQQESVTIYPSRPCLLKIPFLTILRQISTHWNVHNFVIFTCPALCSYSKNLQETGCISVFIEFFPIRISLIFWFSLNLIHSSLTFLTSLVKPSLRSPLSAWNRNSQGTGLEFCMGDETASLHIKGGTFIVSSKAAAGF